MAGTQKQSASNKLFLAAALCAGLALPVNALAESLGSLLDKEPDSTTTGMVNDSEVRGVIIANSETTFSTDLTARVKQLDLKAGSTFKKGQLLISFDCDRYAAELRAANAIVAKQQNILSVKDRLRARGAAGALEVKEARADYQTAVANAQAIKVSMRTCEIKAPFDGRVLERHADPLEMPSPNTPILTVLDSSILEIDLLVPSNWMRWVEPGTEFSFKVQETGDTYSAKVARIGAKVDAVSQTIKITGLLSELPNNVLPGMSGTARFDPPSK